MAKRSIKYKGSFWYRFTKKKKPKQTKKYDPHTPRGMRILHRLSWLLQSCRAVSYYHVKLPNSISIKIADITGEVLWIIKSVMTGSQATCLSFPLSLNLVFFKGINIIFSAFSFLIFYYFIDKNAFFPSFITHIWICFSSFLPFEICKGR